MSTKKRVAAQKKGQEPEFHDVDSIHIGDGMRISVMTVTPELAARWLEKNTSNRPMKVLKVDAFARAMTLGRWRLTHQGIAFDENGVLLDGQNRLAAVVKSKTKVRMLVCFDEPRANMLALDKGTTRDTADTLTILRSEEITKKAVAVARLILPLAEDRACTYYDDDEIDAALRRWKGEFAWLAAIPLANQKLKFAPIAAALIFAHIVKPQEIDKFARLICEPENLPKHSPVYLAIEMCSETFRGGSTTRQWVLRRFLRCAAGFCENEPILRLRDGTIGLDYFKALHAAAGAGQ